MNDASCEVVVICGQDAVELAHQVAANRLRRRVDHRGRCGREGDRAGQRTADRTTCRRRTEGRRSIVVGGGDRQLAGGVHRRGQVVGQQRGIELVERLDRAVGAVAEGDVDRRTAVEGGEGQGLAGEAAGRRGTTRGEAGAVPVLPVRPSAESALPVPMIAEIRQPCRWRSAASRSTIDDVDLAGGDRHRRGTAGVRRGLDAGRKIDRLQRVGNRRALQVDRRVAVAVGDDVTADAGAGWRPLPAAAESRRSENVMVLPLTFSVEPSWIRVPSEAAVIARCWATVTTPEPTDGGQTEATSAGRPCR